MLGGGGGLGLRPPVCSALRARLGGEGRRRGESHEAVKQMPPQHRALCSYAVWLLGFFPVGPGDLLESLMRQSAVLSWPP